ncbi:MAG: alpha/beta hydrolase [Alphaproteobacteria bacterium]|nr:alpha/beta hydrolase [Alphaproteobacteria bacterium]
MTRDSVHLRQKQIEILDPEKREYLSGLMGVPLERSLEERDRMLVIFMHSFPGHKDDHQGFMSLMANLFGEHGFYTFRFDFRGCGQSEGREEDFTLTRARQDLDLVRDWAHKQGFKKFIYVTDGLAAHVAISSFLADVQAMVMFSPLLDGAAYARYLLQAEPEASTPVSGGYHPVKDHRIGEQLIFELMNAGKPTDALPMPILVHYGTKDDRMSPAHLELLKSGLEATRIDITSYQGGTRGLPDPKHRQMVSIHTSQFLKKYF